MLSYHGPGKEYYLNPIPCFWHLQAVEKCLEVGHCLQQKYRDGLGSGHEGPRVIMMVKGFKSGLGDLLKNRRRCVAGYR